jgi:hypothetical protein
MKSKLSYMLLGIVSLFGIAMLYYLVKFSITVYTIIKAHDARIAESYDYTKRTTPLPQNTINDICEKFALNPNDVRCQPGAIVYGPDFFKEIKKYFHDLPKQENIVPIVDKNLGTYLVACEITDKNGGQGCRYDLRGDGKYTIIIYFTKEGFFDGILTPTGGS